MSVCLLRLYIDCIYFLFFFFNDTATTEIYTLSLHDALPILRTWSGRDHRGPRRAPPLSATTAGLHSPRRREIGAIMRDRKSTRLNSSHQIISYAVFGLNQKQKYLVPRPTARTPRHTQSNTAA